MRYGKKMIGCVPWQSSNNRENQQYGKVSDLTVREPSWSVTPLWTPNIYECEATFLNPRILEGLGGVVRCGNSGTAGVKLWT